MLCPDYILENYEQVKGRALKVGDFLCYRASSWHEKNLAQERNVFNLSLN